MCSLMYVRMAPSGRVPNWLKSPSYMIEYKIYIEFQRVGLWSIYLNFVPIWETREIAWKLSGTVVEITEQCSHKCSRIHFTRGNSLNSGLSFVFEACKHTAVCNTVSHQLRMENFCWQLFCPPMTTLHYKFRASLAMAFASCSFWVLYIQEHRSEAV